MQSPTLQQQSVTAPPVTVGPVTAAGATPPATFVYRAAAAGRDELRDQLEVLVQQRHGLLAELDDHNDVSGPATAGMQQRIVQLDQRISDVDKAIAAADAEVARAASIPGAVVAQNAPINIMSPNALEFASVTLLVLLAAMLPIGLYSLRRMFRRSATAVSELPRELMERLGRLEQTGEATALEVERIGEGQRFVTRLMTERADRALSDAVGVRSPDGS